MRTVAHIEYDYFGSVAGGTSTDTTIDAIFGTTCASRSGKLVLVKGTTYSL